MKYTYAVVGLLSFFIISSGYASKALEIQCDTTISEYDLVIKRSPDSQISYALLFTETHLEKYIALKDSFITEESDTAFRYLDEDEAHSIQIDLLSGNGLFKLGWTQLGQPEIGLISCKSTVEQVIP